MPVVASVGCHLMAPLDDAPHYLRGVFGEIGGAEKRSLYSICFQGVENPAGPVAGDFHRFLQGKVDAAFARDIEFFSIKTQQYH